MNLKWKPHQVCLGPFLLLPCQRLDSTVTWVFVINDSIKRRQRVSVWISISNHKKTLLHAEKINFQTYFSFLIHLTEELIHVHQVLVLNMENFDITKQYSDIYEYYEKLVNQVLNVPKTCVKHTCFDAILAASPPFWLSSCFSLYSSSSLYKYKIIMDKTQTPE